MTEEKFTTVDLLLEQSIQRAIGLGEELTDEQKRKILADRAHMLAQPISEADEQPGDTLRVIAFHIGEETYAFPAASVFSVNKSIPVTPVPCVPNFVAGITNLRGHIRSVVNLADFLGLSVELAEGQSPNDEYIVVAQYDDIEVAFRVSGLDEVTDIPMDDIKARPLNPNSRANKYIAGIVPGGLILLDLAAIFTDERFIVNDEII
jgi:purine-binding chemotaxis protein CheW